MIERIFDDDRALALIIRRDYDNQGIHFLTPDNYSQQLGYMKHPKGFIIEPHLHNHVERQVHHTSEVLIIKSGKVRVDFYAHDKHYLESRILDAGDIILLISGGHGFEMLEDGVMIEVKQGPYLGECDKTRFKSVGYELIKYKY